jgi:hypothetical protein
MQIYTKSAIVVLLMADFYEVLSFRLSSGRTKKNIQGNWK